MSRIPPSLSSRVSTSDVKSPESVTEEPKQELNPQEEFIENDISNNGLESVKILVLGLDGSGKTSMLNLLASKTCTDSYQPTTGFNAVQVEKNNLDINIVEG